MKIVLFIIALLIVALPIGIRLLPVRPDKWHVDPFSVGKANASFCPEPGERFFMENPMLEDLSTIITSTPRTSVLAGSVAEGRITWVTRSRLMGFPDVTTAAVKGGRLCIVARQVIGSDDWGVNERRLNGWLETAYGIRPFD